MMTKYGATQVNEHFMSFNTICDATQVSPQHTRLLLWRAYTKPFWHCLRRPE